MSVEVLVYYANIVNYLVTKQLPEQWIKQDKAKLIKKFFRDNTYPFKYCTN